MLYVSLLNKNKHLYLYLYKLHTKEEYCSINDELSTYLFFINV